MISYTKYIEQTSKNNNNKIIIKIKNAFTLYSIQPTLYNIVIQYWFTVYCIINFYPIHPYLISAAHLATEHANAFDSILNTDMLEIFVLFLLFQFLRLYIYHRSRRLKRKEINTKNLKELEVRNADRVSCETLVQQDCVVALQSHGQPLEEKAPVRPLHKSNQFCALNYYYYYYYYYCTVLASCWQSRMPVTFSVRIRLSSSVAAN